MKLRNLLVSPAAILAALSVAVGSPAAADAWDKKTLVTFNEPVELPGGVVLPSGPYMMRLHDSPSNRHIVQVFDRDQSRIYATVLAIPAQRSAPAERTIITFYETPRDEPLFIRNWFYPGDTIGQEFPYSRNRLRTAASTAWTAVPPSPFKEPAAALDQPPHPIVSEATPVEEDRAPEAPRLIALAEQPPPSPAQPSAPQEPEAAAAAPDSSQQLPETASRGPLLALTGAALVLAALALKAVRRLNG